MNMNINDSVIDKLSQFVESFKKIRTITPERKSELTALLTDKPELSIEDIDTIRVTADLALKLIDTDEIYNELLASIKIRMNKAEATNDFIRKAELSNEIDKLNKRFNKKEKKAKTGDKDIDRLLNTLNGI